MKSSFLELENDFIGLKGGELKYRELKIKKGIEELFIKPIIVARDDIDRFEQKEIKKDLFKALGTIGSLIIFPSL